MTNSIGMQLVLVPSGEFDMGLMQEDVDRRLAEAKRRNEPSWYIHCLSSEAPQHRVWISRPFCLGACEVTVGQFRQFAADAGYLTEGEKDRRGGHSGDASRQRVQKPEWMWRRPASEQSDDHPVVDVSWNEAVAFCEWLSRKEGTPYRLPTEAEWEYACRAGTTTSWHCGDRDATLPEYAWFAANRSGEIHPVGQLKPNAWGLFDMHGNVSEWCGDWHDDGYYKNSPPADPMGPGTGSRRVTRGGGWYESAAGCQSVRRFGNQPRFRYSHLGFRVAAVPSASPASPASGTKDGGRAAHKIPSSNGAIHEYIRIVNSVRENGKVKQKVIANLGRRDTLEAVLPLLKRLLRGGDAHRSRGRSEVDRVSVGNQRPRENV